MDGLGNMHDMLSDRFGEELGRGAAETPVFSVLGPVGEAAVAGADYIAAI